MRKILLFLLPAIFTLSNLSFAQTNLAYSAIASASASSGGSYGPSNWNDGQIGVTSNFGWLGTDPTSFPSPAWLKYEWTSPQTITRLRLYNPSHSQGNYVLFAGTADLQYKNGSTWTTISTVSGQTSVYYDIDFAAVTTTEIRLTNFNITGFHNPGWDEIEVYNIQTGTDDVGVYEILMPDTINSLAPSVVDVKIVNYGMTNVDSFDICYMRSPSNMKCMTFYKADFGIPASTIWDTVVVNLDTTVAPLGNFSYTSWTELASDIDNSNDTTFKEIYGKIISGYDDVGVNKILMPDTIYSAFPLAIIDVELVNHGMTNVDSFDICYRRNFQAKKCMTFYKIDYGIPDSLIWDTLVVNLDTIMTPLGNYAITAWTELATDIDNSNDTASKNIFGEINSIGDYDYSENEISIYPQPAKNSITISGNIKDSKIEIFSLNGSLIRDLGLAKEEELNIDISDLSHGIYLLKIQNEDKILTRKISIAD